jgi:hypothetical protein
MKRPADINVVIGIGLFAAAATALYWTLWFAAPGAVQSLTPDDPGYAAYAAYELAFPLPDAFVTVAGLVGAAGLWRMKDWGLFSMLLAAGGGLFLGLEDLLYDLENGIFARLDGAALVELVIVVLLLSLGSAMTLLLWKHRRELVR